MAKLLQPGDVLPSRRLTPLVGDKPASVGPNRKRSQVVVLTHRQPCGDCAGYAASLEEIGQELATEKAEAFVVVDDAWRQAPEALAGLEPTVAYVDESGQLLASLAPDGNPVVVIADQYGQVFARFEAGEHDFPDNGKVLRILLDISLRCPECGVPDVPTENTLPDADATSGGIRVWQ